MLREFREFALRGNVLDMAVGIIIGAAFTAIVSSLVDDVLMPPIGVLMGGFDFSDYFLPLTFDDRVWPSLAAVRAAGVPVIAYGNFVNAVIKFVIVAFALFMVIKQMNNLKRLADRQRAQEAAPPPEPPRQEVLLTEIRDLLKARASSPRLPASPG
ncbi:MAG TPA: large conductance mechanosensitive channel protein MscL [Geminicoccaceae bacterium]|nr:large conductance mechanosensitive channel protein MscL [Geminicoccaceae bacterium]